MIGIVLGLGFQWWPNLHEPWQYIAFVFVYIDIIDYWIDYAASRKKYPSKRESEILLDVAIMFTLFLYIYATQVTINYFLLSFIALSFFDFVSIVRTKLQHAPMGSGGAFFSAYLLADGVNMIFSAALIVATYVSSLSPLTILTMFIGARILMRVIATFKHKSFFFKG